MRPVAASYTGIMAFMAVASEGSFAKAGDRLGIGRSAVSRNVQKLEAYLGTRLFLRSTRLTRLTSEGQRFLDNCQQGVTHIQQAIDDMLELRRGPPRGPLRIVSSVAFGRAMVAPLLDPFQRRYPGIVLDLRLDDDCADFVAQRIDVCFRHGRLEDSSIIARQLVSTRMVLCAAPAYVAQFGMPQSPDELAEHRCINARGANGRLVEWEFRMVDRIHRVLPEASLVFNDSGLALDAVLDGRGMAQLPCYQVADHIASGHLKVVMADYLPDPVVHYICYPSRQHLPARIRVFIDFIAEHIPRAAFQLPIE
nr:LysR family transcriptional regulator [Cupriavidus agavae]